MNYIISNNGIKILYTEDYENYLSICFLRFGLSNEIYDQLGIIHFIEHIITELLEDILPNDIIVTATTSYNFMTIEISTINGYISYRYIKFILNTLFNESNIFINNKYITNSIIKRVKYHIQNEYKYRILLDKYFPNPLNLLIFGSAYIGGTGLNIDIDINYFNSILKQINTEDILIITNQKDIFNSLISDINNIKRKMIKHKKNKDITINKSNNKNSVLLYSLGKYYMFTVLIELNRYNIIGVLLDQYCLFKKIVSFIYNNILCINYLFMFASELIDYLSYIINFNENNIINLDDMKYEYNTLVINDYFYDYLTYLPYIDIRDIIANINNNDISMYNKEYNSYLLSIKNNINNRNKFFLTTPYNGLLNNMKDRNNQDLFYTETRLQLYNNVTLLPKRYTKDINIPLHQLNNIYFIISCNEKKIDIENNNIILKQPDNVYTYDNKIFSINTYYNTSHSINLYEKYFLFYLFTNTFIDLDTLIIEFKKKYVINLDGYTIIKNENIIISNKIINIKTEFTFVVLFLKYPKSIKLITNLGRLLVNKHLIYVIHNYHNGDKYYLFIITDNPIKVEKLSRKYFNNNYIINIFSIISLRGKSNYDELNSSKLILFK
ncbi:putative vaccinia G1L metaloprotease [Alphaentomopoxvirus acuprea]|uniref:Putative vaccinia G1L metaloprotease n=1 Tax=Alphaentomopoxvirus acuprea TaxID=62099 RepID=W6JPM6_9POXV|nr:putative vaccinia G1L metaloprotease [Anomala cuprea entomopoxvirus]BAO49544.1 putative vaccinia G1L metaloprotease [Anomala cuprea entomopoxvirus]